MAEIQPFVREAGNGPAVVCIHCNSSSSSQWRALTDKLAGRFRVISPDSYGAGRTTAWPLQRTITLGDEVELLSPVLDRAGSPFVLAGHSYGGAVALLAALRRKEQVRALVLYEPTLFSLIEAESPPPNDADGIRNVGVLAGQALAQGRADLAAQAFIDYWMGAGSWSRMPPERQPPITASIPAMPSWWTALSTEPTPLQAFAQLRMPILYMLGKQSPLAAQGVARRLLRVLPNATVVEFEGIGHMGPVTHPAVVNEAIERFLVRLPG